MLMIRLQRQGAKGRPMYRVVVSDSRRRPTSSVLDRVGFYNPHTDPPEIKIDFAKLEEWRNKGAQLSETVRSLVKRAKRSN